MCDGTPRLQSAVTAVAGDAEQQQLTMHVVISRGRTPKLDRCYRTPYLGNWTSQLVLCKLKRALICLHIAWKFLPDLYLDSLAASIIGCFKGQNVVCAGNDLEKAANIGYQRGVICMPNLSQRMPFQAAHLRLG